VLEILSKRMAMPPNVKGFIRNACARFG